MSETLNFPLASIIIPTYNGLRFLPTCLEALHGQTYTRHEIIVVDDASSDETVSYLQATEPAVRVVQMVNNRGLAAACNAGAAAAQG
ncbi:MAG: glycosyltransferase, partial [Anaerolineae bacterium]